MASEAPSTSSNSNDRGVSPHALLAWRWLLAGLTLFIVSSIGAWWQEPGPVPLNRSAAGWSILRPIEINPHRRLPAILDNLRTMHVSADGQHAWIAGDRGRILATDDGGDHWHAQNTGTTQDLSVVAFRKDGQSGWAGNEQIALLSTTNAGRQWNKTATPWEVVMQRAPDAGFALPKPGAGGAKWKESFSAVITSRPSDPISANDPDRPNTELSKLSLTFMKGSILRSWLVGENGTIVASAGVSDSWHPQTSTSQPRLQDLWVNGDGARGLAVGVHGTILATADHGATWTRQTAGIDTSLVAVTCLADANIAGLAVRMAA